LTTSRLSTFVDVVVEVIVSFFLGMK